MAEVSQPSSLTLEPNPFEQSFASKTQEQAAQKNDDRDENNLDRNTHRNANGDATKIGAETADLNGAGRKQNIPGIDKIITPLPLIQESPTMAGNAQPGYPLNMVNMANAGRWMPSRQGPYTPSIVGTPTFEGYAGPPGQIGTGAPSVGSVASSQRPSTGSVPTIDPNVMGKPGDKPPPVAIPGRATPGVPGANPAGQAVHTPLPQVPLGAAYSEGYPAGVGRPLQIDSPGILMPMPSNLMFSSASGGSAMLSPHPPHLHHASMPQHHAAAPLTPHHAGIPQPQPLLQQHQPHQQHLSMSAQPGQATPQAQHPPQDQQPHAQPPSQQHLQQPAPVRSGLIKPEDNNINPHSRPHSRSHQQTQPGRPGVNSAASGLYLLSQDSLSHTGVPKDAPAAGKPSITSNTRKRSTSNSTRIRVNGDSNAAAASATTNGTGSEKKETNSVESIRKRSASDLSNNGDSGIELKRAKLPATAASHRESPNSDAGNNDQQHSDHGGNGSELEESERRKLFLERNRIAAIKCRQRKKQWVDELKTKADIYSQVNEELQQANQKLKTDIEQLKQFVLAFHDIRALPPNVLNIINIQVPGGPSGAGVNPHWFPQAPPNQHSTQQDPR